MFKEIINNVKEKVPLVHNITNYVTVNDVANSLIAYGAAPIMADDPKEVEEITALCQGTNINIGTLNERTITSMVLAGQKANALKQPVLLDPVGIGASNLRTETAMTLIKKINFDVIRGNMSEMKAIALGTGGARGVDADAADAISQQNLSAVVELAVSLSERIGSVVAISGAIDVVAHGHQVAIVRNGSPLMAQITGSGCMLSALTTATLAANPVKPFRATVTAFCVMGVAGEMAEARMTETDGNASYRNYLIDGIYNLDAAVLERRSNCEIREA